MYERQKRPPYSCRRKASNRLHLGSLLEKLVIPRFPRRLRRWKNAIRPTKAAALLLSLGLDPRCCCSQAGVLAG